MQNTDLKELLDYIDPASLNYQEWVNVGMALKYEDILQRTGMRGVCRIQLVTIRMNASRNGTPSKEQEYRSQVLRSHRWQRTGAGSRCEAAGGNWTGTMSLVAMMIL